MADFPELVVKSRGVPPILYHHPWIFEDSILKYIGKPATGNPVRVVSEDDRFLCYALFSEKSVIKARAFSFDESMPIDKELMRRKLENAIKLRELVIPEDTNSYRLVFGEGDMFPGLVVDKYDDVIGICFTTASTYTWSETILDLLEELLSPSGIVALPDPVSAMKEGFEHAEGCFRGAVSHVLSVMENGIHYQIDRLNAQRKMLYFDQRENRAIVANLASGKMLDLCSYSGGFSLNALVNGDVERVLAVDSSAQALEQFRVNAHENDVAKHAETMQDDAEAACQKLLEDGESYDTVVLDPPRLVPDRKSLDRGLRKYTRLNTAALKLVKNGGIFVSCSCSGLVDRHSFLRSVAIASVRAGKELSLIELRGQAPCHPVSAYCPETSYLKCAIFRVQ